MTTGTGDLYQAALRVLSEVGAQCLSSCPGLNADAGAGAPQQTDNLHQAVLQFLREAAVY